jgi:hypothetical protein
MMVRSAWPEANIIFMVNLCEVHMNLMDRIIFILLFLLFPLSTFSQEKTDINDNKLKGINIGAIYQSKYYWRGQWFYGQSAGVFFPYISYGRDNLYLYAGGEYGENIVFDSANSNESGFGTVEKDWSGIDLGAVYAWNIAQDHIGLSAGAWYFWYLRSKYIENDGINNSFADLRIAASLKKVFLTPTLSYSHYLRVDDDYSKRTTEDFYISLAFLHDIPFAPGTTINLGGTIHYWHYASKEQSPLYGRKGEIPSGFSDSTFKFGLTMKNQNLTFRSSINYAYVFSDKFDYTSGSRFDRNKFWTSFAVDYAF